MGVSCLLYDDKKIVPAPLINIDKTYNITSDGQHLGTTYALQLIGTLLPFRGSPSGNYVNINNAFLTVAGDPPDQTFENPPGDFNSLLRKQEAMRFLFKDPGKSLEWTPSSGVAVRCNPRINGISFPEGTWTQRSDYTIDLEADTIFINGIGTEDTALAASGSIKSATEQWNFQDVPGLIGSGFNVTHTVTAQGLASYEGAGNLISNKQPWDNAKDFVDARVAGSVDATIMLSTLGVAGWLGGKYTKNTDVSETDGTYTVSEAWLLMPVNFFIEQNFDFNTSDGDGQDLPEISYNGRITGISNNERLGGAVAIANARAAIPSDAVARTDIINNLGSLLDSLAVPTTPASTTIGVDNTQGVVTFRFTWKAGADNNTSNKKQDATLSFSVENGVWTLDFTCNIEGFGADAATRVSNAKAQILSDSAARTAALVIIGDQIPAGVTISTDHRAKSISINNSTGVIRTSWTWDSSDDNNVTINVNTTLPANVIASLAIPGRDEGPIIQQMGTVTSKIIAVTLDGQYDIEPSDASIATQMNAAIDEALADVVITADQKTFSTQTGKYTRSRTYTVKS